MIAAVIFDVFGTLLEIQRRENPYRQLLRIGAHQGRPVSPADPKRIMTLDSDLSRAADLFGIKLSSSQLSQLQEMLDIELESIRPYDDSMPAIDLLRESGIKIGLCSNLAKPYCPVVRGLVSGMDGYALSAEIGLVKPEAQMYEMICAELKVVPGQIFGSDAARVLMIGDSRRCDVDGPRTSGIIGHHLDRKGTGPFRNLLEFAGAVRSVGVQV